MPRDLAALRELIGERSPLDADATAAIVRGRFDHLPQRLRFALRRWPLEQSAVLDVGSAYATCLVHFGPGSVGVDNSTECVEFTRALGLEAVLADVEDDAQLAQVADGSFDYLWVSDVLEHLDAPRVLLRRLAPKLRPGGTLLLQTSVLPHSRLARWALRRIGERPYDAEVHYHQWTVDTIRHLLERAGYATVRIVPVLPARLAGLTARIPVSIASRAIVEARPDPALVAQAERAEARNRHLLER
jgi:SAM-dependent methyltransferase